MRFFKRWFAPKKTAAKPLASVRDIQLLDMSAPEIQQYIQAGDEALLRYPPFQRGWPARVPGTVLLQPHKVTLQKLSSGVRMPNRGFDRLLLPVFEGVAEFVHLLPASQSHHHRGPGGLLAHSLEVAMFAFNSCKCTSFDYALYPAQRLVRENRWYVAAVLAALMHDLGKVLSDVVVADEMGDRHWDPMGPSIPVWAAEHDIDRYYLSWTPNRHGIHRDLAATLIARFLPQELLIWLRAEGADIYTEMVNAMSGREGDKALALIVSKCDSKSVELDMQKHGGDASRQFGMGSGVPIPALVLDTMIHFLATKTWRINEPGQRVWIIGGEVYVVWSQSAAEVAEYLHSQGVKAIPRSADVLGGILLDHGVVAKADDGSMYWHTTIDMINVGREKPITLKCLKLVNPEALFKFETPPASVAATVGLPPHELRFDLPHARGTAAASVVVLPEAPHQEGVDATLPAPAPAPAPAQTVSKGDGKDAQHRGGPKAPKAPGRPQTVEKVGLVPLTAVHSGGGLVIQGAAPGDDLASGSVTKEPHVVSLSSTLDKRSSSKGRSTGSSKENAGSRDGGTALAEQPDVPQPASTGSPADPQHPQSSAEQVTERSGAVIPISPGPTVRHADAVYAHDHFDIDDEVLELVGMDLPDRALIAPAATPADPAMPAVMLSTPPTEHLPPKQGSADSPVSSMVIPAALIGSGEFSFGQLRAVGSAEGIALPGDSPLAVELPAEMERKRYPVLDGQSPDLPKATRPPMKAAGGEIDVVKDSYTASPASRPTQGVPAPNQAVNTDPEATAAPRRTLKESYRGEDAGRELASPRPKARSGDPRNGVDTRAAAPVTGEGINDKGDSATSQPLPAGKVGGRAEHAPTARSAGNPGDGKRPAAGSQNPAGSRPGSSKATRPSTSREQPPPGLLISGAAPGPAPMIIGQPRKPRPAAQDAVSPPPPKSPLKPTERKAVPEVAASEVTAYLALWPDLAAKLLWYTRPENKDLLLQRDGKPYCLHSEPGFTLDDRDALMAANWLFDDFTGTYTGLHRKGFLLSRYLGALLEQVTSGAYDHSSTVARDAHEANQLQATADAVISRCPPKKTDGRTVVSISDRRMLQLAYELKTSELTLRRALIAHYPYLKVGNNHVIDLTEFPA